MPLSFVQHIGDGATPNFSVPFGYLDKSHIAVTVDGVATTSYTWLTESQIQITPNAVGIVEIRRNTPKDIRAVVWANAANLTETDLNVADLQVFYLVQEAYDQAVNSILLVSDNKFDAQNKVIKNVSDGTAPTDAVNKSQLDVVTDGMQNYVDAAAVQVALAEDQAEIATAQAEIATTQAGIATNKAIDADNAVLAAQAAQTAAEASANSLKYRAVRLATLGNISLSGIQTIDGIPGASGDVILVKNQTTTSQNGVYIMQSGAWIRSSDSDTWNKLVSQCRIISEGNAQADTLWVCTADAGGTIGTTAVNWIPLPAFVADASITLAKLASTVYPSQAEAEAGTDTTKLATPQRVAQSVAFFSPNVPRRQCVIAAPLDTAGYPNWCPGTATGLTLTTQNISSSTPLVITSADGSSISRNGVRDIIGLMTSNASFPTLLPNTTHYLQASINTSTGALSLSYSGFPCIYQWGGAPSITSGQYTYNIQEGQMYLGNGTTAQKINNVVFLGEAVTDASNITGVILYALQGRYEVANVVNPQNNGRIDVSHKLGVTPKIWNISLQNISADRNWNPANGGDRIQLASSNSAGGNNAHGVYVDRLRVGMALVSGAGMASVTDKNGGTEGLIDNTKWKVNFYADRGW